MSSAIPSRRKRKLIATIVADPYRKLAAIGLALGLWYYLNGQITRPLDVPMTLTHGLQAADAEANHLRVRLGSSDVIGTRFSAAGKDLAIVTITFTGQSADLDQVKRGSLELTVDFPGDTDWSNRDYIEFEARHIQRTDRLRGLELEMDPPLVRLNVEQVAEHTLVMGLDIVDLRVDTGDDLGSRLRLDTATFQPETVVVRGPAGRIDEVRSAERNKTPLFTATIASGRNDGPLILPLTPRTTPNSGVTFERAGALTMTIQVNPKTEPFELVVPIIVDDLALEAAFRNQYRPADGATHLSVTVKAGGKLLHHLTFLEDQEDGKALADWARRHLRLNVWLEPWDPTLQPPPERTVSASLRVQGSMWDQVTDYSLADSVPIVLRRQQ